MPTKFSDIYERAMYKFTDYSFLNSTADAAKEKALQFYLMSSIVDVQRGCNIDLSNYNALNAEFNIVLDNEIIELLALGVAFYWLSAKTLNSELLKNRIHKSDLKFYSPAELLKTIKTLRDTIESEFRGKINTYSIRNGHIDTLKT